MAENKTHGDIWCMSEFMDENDISANRVKTMEFFKWLAGEVAWKQVGNKTEGSGSKNKTDIRRDDIPEAKGPPMGHYDWVSKVDDDTFLNMALFFDEYMAPYLTPDTASQSHPSVSATRSSDPDSPFDLLNSLLHFDTSDDNDPSISTATPIISNSDTPLPSTGTRTSGPSPSSSPSPTPAYSNLTLIGRPMSWGRPYNYTSGRFYTMSSPLLRLYARLFTLTRITDEAEDVLTGRLLHMHNITDHTLIPIAEERAFDVGWEGLVTPSTILVHDLKSDETFLKVASLYDERGFAVGEAEGSSEPDKQLSEGHEGIKGLTSYDSTMEETVAFHEHMIREVGSWQYEQDAAYKIGKAMEMKGEGVDEGGDDPRGGLREWVDPDIEGLE